MANAFGDNTGYAQTIFAYKEFADKEAITFVGRTHGKIVEPKGSRKFGWDCIFLPDGKDQTYGELDGVEKNKISQRSKALMKMMEFFDKDEEVKEE